MSQVSILQRPGNMANFLGVLEDPQCADLYKRWRNRTWLPSPISPQGTYRIPTEQASVLMTDLLALTPYNHTRGCLCVQCEVHSCRTTSLDHESSGQSWKLVVNTTQSESKDVISKAQSSVAREESEGLLKLSGLSREAEVQEGSSSSPTMMQGRPVPGVAGIKCWVRGVDLADSRVLDSRLRWGGRRSREPGSHSMAQSLYLVYLFPPEIIPTKTRGSYTDQKCWCQGFYKVPGVL